MPFDRWAHVIAMRVRSLFRGAALDRDLDEELESHLERLIEDNVTRGMSPESARRAALIAMGGLQQRREECRERRRVHLVDELVQDARYAARSLRQSPTFTLAAIATLTLGIGASVAMFAVVNGVLLRPLPFPDHDRLFLVAMSPRNPFVTEPSLSDHNYVALRSHNTTFASLATFSTFDGSLAGAAEPVLVKAGSVTSEFFAVLGVAPALGRTFTDDEARSGAEPTVVLSEPLWRVHFSADPSVDRPRRDAERRPQGRDRGHASGIRVSEPGRGLGAADRAAVPGQLADVSGDRPAEAGDHHRAGARAVRRHQPSAAAAAACRRCDVDRWSAAAQGDAGWPRAPAVDDFLGRGDLRAADCLRERGPPAARAGLAPPARNRRTGRARRHPGAADPATAHREHPARARRRRRRRARRPLDRPRAARARAPGAHPAAGDDSARRLGRRLRDGRVARHRAWPSA